MEREKQVGSWIATQSSCLVLTLYSPLEQNILLLRPERAMHDY